MRTLSLRNVPDEVVERLQRLAARDGTSVGAVAVRELAEVSRRADNPALEVAGGLRRRVVAGELAAKLLGHTPLTADARLGRAPGRRCTVTVVAG